MTFKATPITSEVRVHTGMNKAVKVRIEALARHTGYTQADIVNTLLTQALAKVPSTRRKARK